MRHRAALSVALAVFVLPLVATGCPKKKQAPADSPTAPAATTTPTPKPTPSKPDVTGDKWDEQGIPDDKVDEGSLGSLANGMRTVYFAFDSYELTPSSVATLRQNADLLKGHPGATIVVEGHADERGTIEYNLSLSEKRASAVRDYLSSLGVDRSRVRIVPYGEERPVESGHNEPAYSKNRRAEFLED